MFFHTVSFRVLDSEVGFICKIQLSTLPTPE